MTASTTSYFALVEAELAEMTERLVGLVPAKHPVLKEAAEYLFQVSGKRIRPAIVLLAAKATAPAGVLSERHRRLAEITEMIHTAGLVHDDVIDTSNLRRGIDTVNAHFTNKIAVLAGDFLFAKASVYLSRLGSLEVVELLATVLEHFGEGEMIQSSREFDPELPFEEYIDKSFYKTASLLAGSSKAAAVLSDAPRPVCEALYEYGRHLGIAFQVVDDLLDFTGSTATLGKPAASDLQEGHVTAPVLYALEEFPELATLIERRFGEEGDFEKALRLVHASHGIARSRDLARHHARLALDALEVLTPSPARQALADLHTYVLERLH